MELREPIRTRSLVCHRRFGAYLHAQRLRLGLTVEDLSKESNFWWLPSQLDTIERGSTLLHPDEIVDLAELYRVGGKWPGSDEWQLSFDGSTRERITAHTDPGSRTGIERLADELLGRINGIDLASIIIRLLALVQLTGADIEMPAIGLADDNPAVSSIARACEVPPDAVIRARQDVALRRAAAVSSLKSDLQYQMAVPAIGLLIFQGPGGSVSMTPKIVKRPSGAPTDLLSRRCGVDDQSTSIKVPAAGPLGFFTSGVLHLERTAEASQLRI